MHQVQQNSGKNQMMEIMDKQGGKHNFHKS